MSVLLLVVGLLLFVSLVIIHELGHFITARRNGVEVEEFGIGFPPQAWHKKMKSGFNLSLNWLPLGGFVKLRGEHDADKSPGSFGAAKLGAKVRIMLAGVGMNLLAAFVLLSLLALVGLPKIIDNQFTVNRDTRVSRSEVLVGYVEPKSPAELAGLQIQDQITEIGEPGSLQSVFAAQQLPKLTEKLAGKDAIITYKRMNTMHQTAVRLRGQTEVEKAKNSDNPKGYLGISPTDYQLRRSTWSAPIVALGLMKQLTIATFKGLGSALGSLFRGHGGEASQQVSGPVGIFVLLKNGSLLGYQFVLLIVAVISLTLAIMNILPIPALDGGRLFVTLVYRAIKRPLKQNTEELIHGAGFAFLMILFVLITIIDVRRFF